VQGASDVRGICEALGLTLLGVANGNDEVPVSVNVPLYGRSDLLPARSSVRLGEARALASLKKEESDVNGLWDVIS
jgi:hypothetical protein